MKSYSKTTYKPNGPLECECWKWGWWGDADVIKKSESGLGTTRDALKFADESFSVWLKILPLYWVGDMLWQKGSDEIDKII